MPAHLCSSLHDRMSDIAGLRSAPMPLRITGRLRSKLSDDGEVIRYVDVLDAHTPTHDASLNDALIPLRFKVNPKELIA